MGDLSKRVELRVRAGFTDPAGVAARHDLEMAGLTASDVKVHRIFFLQGTAAHPELFADRIREESKVDGAFQGEGVAVSVWKQPGVMDPAEASICRALRTLGHEPERAVTALTYWIQSDALPQVLADRLEDQDVGIDRHPQGQDEAGDAG